MNILLVLNIFLHFESICDVFDKISEFLFLLLELVILESFRIVVGR